MPRRVKVAIWVAFCQHGILILWGRYRLSYDAFVHMFFADHYLKNWWSLWEPRWYTGFEVTSYPPLIHQLNAILGSLIGVDMAFAVLLWAVLTAYPLAVYYFSRIFTGRGVASYAAFGAAFLPSLYISAHTFGQLPTLASTLFVLFGSVALADFLKGGEKLTGGLAIALFATAMAAHHATLLFQPVIAGAVLLHTVLQHKGNRFPIFLRFALFGVTTALAALIVIWPFWLWGSHQEIQKTIDHLSRHNFIKDPLAAGMFFLPMYGLLMLFIPFGVWMGLRKRFWGLGLAFLFLFLVGLGDTTPLPRLLFGAGWAWLTYDRFAFWATLTLLPFFGMAVAWLRRRKYGRRSWFVLIGLMGVTSLVIGDIPAWLPTQPKPIDMRPIVDFLAEPDHSQYRYVTFGFGDQLAYLSRLTTATTIDGSYNTARTLPELRDSGIAQIDTAFWFPGGLAALDPILQKSGEHGVRWGFVNSWLYVPELERNGWIKLTRLSNGVDVWENPTASLPPPIQPPAENPFAAFSWGTFPLLTFLVTLALAIRRYGSFAHQRILEAAQTFAIGLLPLGLTFWYYRTLFFIDHPRIYFTYSNILVFLCDALAFVIVLVGFIQYLPVPGSKTNPKAPFNLKESLSHPISWLFAICCLSSLSSLWSLEWRTSLYISAHLWLCFGLYYFLRKTPRAWLWFSLGCCAALFIQAVIGIGEFFSQSTALTIPLGLTWPGNLLPSLRGASVVLLADGARWLRAYGTLPHPNLLGGFTLAMFSGPLTLFLRPNRQRDLALALFILALVLMTLTFSRNAALGLALLGVGLFLNRNKLNSKKLIALALTSMGTLFLLFLFLLPLFRSRLGAEQVYTEQASNYTRFWLMQRALELIQKRPLLGSGIGSFSLALSQHVAEFYQIEPVHNVPLLVASELGIPGILLLCGLVVTLVKSGFRLKSPGTIVYYSALIGLGATSFFDHYLWTLAPGRILLAAMLGLWESQARADELRG